MPSLVEIDQKGFCRKKLKMLKVYNDDNNDDYFDRQRTQFLFSKKTHFSLTTDTFLTLKINSLKKTHLSLTTDTVLFWTFSSVELKFV